MKASVLLTARSADRKYQKCMEHLRAQDYPDYEIVDVVTSKPGGEGMMEAMRLSTGDVLLFIDSDCYAPRDWVSMHMRCYEPVDAVITGGARTLKQFAFRSSSMSRRAFETLDLSKASKLTHTDMDFGMQLEKAGIRAVAAPHIRVFHDDAEGPLKRFSHGFNAGLAMKRNEPSFSSADLRYLKDPVSSFGALMGLVYPRKDAFSFVHNRRKDT